MKTDYLFCAALLRRTLIGARALALAHLVAASVESPEVRELQETLALDLAAEDLGTVLAHLASAGDKLVPVVEVDTARLLSVKVVEAAVVLASGGATAASALEERDQPLEEPGTERWTNNTRLA